MSAVRVRILYDDCQVIVFSEKYSQAPQLLRPACAPLPGLRRQPCSQEEDDGDEHILEDAARCPGLLVPVAPRLNPLAFQL